MEYPTHQGAVVRDFSHFSFLRPSQPFMKARLSVPLPSLCYMFISNSFDLAIMFAFG